MKMKQPESVDELYKKARFILLYCSVSANLNPYGKLYNPRRYYTVKDWGSFIIRDTTMIVLNREPPSERIEIPKYAAVKYI